MNCSKYSIHFDLEINPWNRNVGFLTMTPRLFGRPAAPRGGVAGTNIDPKNRQKKKQQKPLARGDEGAGGASNGDELDAGRGAMCKGKRGQPFDVEFACLSRVGVGTGLYQIERAL